MQADGNFVFAQRPDRLIQVDLAALDGVLLRRERVRDVLGRYRTEQLIVFAGLARDGDRHAPTQFREILRFADLASLRLRRCACRSCSTIFLFESVAGTASFLGSRKLRA